MMGARGHRTHNATKRNMILGGAAYGSWALKSPARLCRHEASQGSKKTRIAGTIRGLAIWTLSPECKNLGWKTAPRSPPSREFRHKRPQCRPRWGRFFACGITMARAFAGSTRAVRQGGDWQRTVAKARRI